MTDKLMCPFCGTELVGVIARPVCMNQKCEMFAVSCDKMVWEKFATVINGLKELASYDKNVLDYYGGVSIDYHRMVCDMQEKANKTLKELTNESIPMVDSGPFEN